MPEDFLPPPPPKKQEGDELLPPPPLKKTAITSVSPNQKPVSVGSKPLPQGGGLSPFISKPKEKKLKGFAEVGVVELEKQGVVQPPPPMRIEPTIDPNVTRQLKEQKTQEDIARETKVDTKRNEYNFVKAFKSGVDDFKRAEDIFTDLIAVDVTGDPTPLINRMEQEYAEYQKRGVVNKYEETPAAYVANLFGNQAITIAGALGTSALLSPIVGIAYGGIAAGSQSAGATFEQDYYELRDKGLSPEEAYKQAYELAQTSLGFGAIEGTAGAIVPAGKLATGVKEATKQVAKDALFDVSIATVAQGAQNEIEANKGLSRELTDGMVENATGEAVFSIIMGSFVKGREVLKNKPKVLYELSQAPEEVIQADLEARVENGVATPEEAEAAMQDIIQYKEKLTKVPDNFTDEQKQKSVELITQRDDLQASIEGKDEALVKPQKEQIELINTQLEQIANEPITRDEIRGTDAVEEAVREQPAISETGVEKAVTEEVVLPEQGEEVQLEPRIKGGQPRIMVYDEGVWKEKVGNTLSEVSSKQQQEAQEKYANEKPSPEKMDVGEQARDGEEMGERNPQEEITQEGEEKIAVEPSAVEKGQVSGEVTTEPDALKDVESTAKALEGVDISSIEDVVVEKSTKQDRDYEDDSFNTYVEQYTESEYLNEAAKQSFGKLYSELDSKQKNVIDLQKKQYWQGDGFYGLDLDAFYGKTDKEARLSFFNIEQGNNKSLSEAYHKAKADGSNPELVKAVEELLGAPKETTKIKSAAPIEKAKADIERRREEALKKSPVTVFTFKKINPNGENTDVTDKQKQTIERVIQQAIDAGKSADEIVGVLNGAGYVVYYPGQTGNADISLRTYLKNRIDGTEKRDINEYSNTDIHKEINAKYDAELAALESQAKPLQTEAESKAKAELEPEIKSNLEKIQEETGTNFREIQNVYNKYGEGKPLNEITVEDYRAAEAKRQEAKAAPKVVTSETIKEIVPEKTIEAVKALTRAKKAMTESARTKVEETAKDAPNFDKAKYIMDNLENIKAKLLESGKLTTDCKWR